MRIVGDKNDTTPLIDLLVEGTNPAIRVRQEGSAGNAFEVVRADGTVIGGIDHNGAAIGGGSGGAPASATYTLTVSGTPGNATYTAYNITGGVAQSASDTATVSGLKTVLEGLAADGVHFHFAGARFHFLDAPLGTESYANTQCGASFNGYRGLMFTGEGMTKTILSSRSNTITASPDLAILLFTNCTEVTIRDLSIEQCGAWMSTMEAFNGNQATLYNVTRVKFHRAKSTAMTFDGGDDGKVANRNVVRDSIFAGRPPQTQATYITTGGGNLTTATAYQYATAFRDADLGYFTAVTGASSGTTATLTTASAHGFAAGEQVTVQSMSDAGYNGQYTIVSTPTTTTFTYVTAGSNLAAGTGGVVVGPAYTKMSDPSYAYTTINGVTKANVVLPIGPYTTTQRLVYRYNGTNWKLVQTISDNTTTTWQDTTADGTGTVVTLPLSFRSLIPHSGIQLLANSGSIVSNNIVDGTGDHDNASTSDQGIRIALKNAKPSNDNIITGNRVRATGSTGIYLIGAKGNVVANNEVSNPGQQGTNTDVYGNAGAKAQHIRLDLTGGVTSDNNVISGNRCYDDQTAASPSTGATTNNVLTITSGGGVDNTIVGNILTGNTSAAAISDGGTNTRNSSNIGANNLIAKTVNYTMLSSETAVKATTGAGGITVTLPDATKAPTGQMYHVYKADSGAGALTIGSTAGTINGAATISVTTQFSSRSFMTDGATWQIVNSVGA